MNDRITLTMQDILEKEFKIDARGYRPQEVDKFLDIIIKKNISVREDNFRKIRTIIYLGKCCI